MRNVKPSPGHHTLVLLLATLMPQAALPGQQPPRAAVVQAFVDSAARATLHDTPAAGISVLVARGSDIIVDTGYGYADLENDVPASSETVYNVASITKQFVAAGIMRLVEQHKLELDQDIASFFPRFPFGGRHVTIRELLSNTSGLHNVTELPSYVAMSRTVIADDSILGAIAAHPFDFEPGTGFHYSNTNYQMLDMIIERVNGHPLLIEYLQQTFLTPLGLAETRSCDPRPIIKHRASGYLVDSGRLVNPGYVDAWGARNLCTTTHDLLTWSRALTNGRAVSAATLHLMTVPAKLANGTPVPEEYGLGLYVAPLDGHRAISGDGGGLGFRARLANFPDDSLVVIVLANTIEPPPYHNPSIQALERSIDRFTLGLPDVKRLLYTAYEQGGADSAIRLYHSLAAHFPKASFDPGQLYAVGAQLLKTGDVPDAIRVLQLNAGAFPDDWEVYDSLGDAYMAHGDSALATTNYERSLEMNPRNDNAAKALAKLRAQHS
jgi:CubicO group peptidase (beta-lactamase class C family)